MKNLKKIAFAAVVTVLFVLSGCNVMEEPDFNTEVGGDKTETPGYED